MRTLSTLRPLAPLGLSALAASAFVAAALLVGGTATAQTPPAAAPSAAGPAAAPAAPPAAAPSSGRLPPPRANVQVLDTSAPFSHDDHMNVDKVGKALDCKACHEMVNDAGQCPKTEIRFPKHEACAGCHMANFYTPPLTICTNCHKNAGFTKSNPMKDLTRIVTPRKAEFNHAKHVRADNNNCTSCHEFVKAGEQVSHPSHPNCCQCHDGVDVKPAMSDCQACHSAALNAGRPPSKIHDFSHKVHREDPRTGESLQCGQCHINANTATTLRNIPIPPMSSCVQCHDGSDPGKPHPTITMPGKTVMGSGAFHFSSCLKCHIAGSIQGIPLPPGHPTDAAPAGAIQ